MHGISTLQGTTMDTLMPQPPHDATLAVAVQDFSLGSNPQRDGLRQAGVKT
jgi:hypothetical protein